MVFFDAARIEEVAADTAGRAGLPVDMVIGIDVDEASMLQRLEVVSFDGTSRLALRVQGGAFEDRKRSRHLSDDAVRTALARVFFRVADRLSPGFAEAAVDADLDLRHLTAWDAYSMGRAERAGLPSQRSRRLYHFRNRHGFSDVSDAVFDRLWSASTLGWGDIEAACAETAAARGRLGAQYSS